MPPPLWGAGTVYATEAAYLAAQFSSFAGETEAAANMNCLAKNVDVCMDMFEALYQSMTSKSDRTRSDSASSRKKIRGSSRRRK